MGGKAKANARIKAFGRVKTTREKAKSLKPDAHQSGPQPVSSAVLLGLPTVQRSLIKTAIASTGPAKGWKLLAWLAERKGKSKSVRWRALSPQRTHAFDTFRLLRDSVGEGIYTHIREGMR